MKGGEQRPIEGLVTGECFDICANAACVFVSGSRRARTSLSHIGRVVSSRFRNWTPSLARQSGLLDFHAAVVSGITPRDTVRHGVRSAAVPNSDLLEQSTVNLPNGTPGSPISPVTGHSQRRRAGSLHRQVVVRLRSYDPAASSAGLFGARLGQLPIHRDDAILSRSGVAEG